MSASNAAPQQGGVATGAQNKMTKATLTDQDAVEIYLARYAKGRHDAALLAGRFNVTAKAIRDIWRRRTWWRATRHLWTPEEKTKHLRNLLCPTCKFLNVDSQTDACQLCARQIAKATGTTYPGGALKQTDAVSIVASLSDEWDILPIEPALSAACDLARACATSREQAFLDFPHEQLYTNVQFDEAGWLIDNRMLAFFIANSVDMPNAAISQSPVITQAKPPSLELTSSRSERTTSQP
jgi:hypothetical protein